MTDSELELAKVLLENRMMFYKLLNEDADYYDKEGAKVSPSLPANRNAYFNCAKHRRGLAGTIARLDNKIHSERIQED